MMKPLPMLVSIPHGGMEIPDIYRKRLILSPLEVAIDSDTWSQELYDFQGAVEAVVKADIARIMVDLNRSIYELPARNPDGVVKTVTVSGKRIWAENDQLNASEIAHLIQQYYRPFHEKLYRYTQSESLRLAVDCHTMLGRDPLHTKGVRHLRPVFCISNRGSRDGLHANEHLTAPSEVMLHMKTLLEEQFSYLTRRPEQPLVEINNPFRGGYITAYHGRRSHFPWIQLEINRRIYLPSDEKVTLKPDEEYRQIMAGIRERLYWVFRDLIRFVTS